MYSVRVAQIKPKLDLDDPLRQPRLLAAAFVLYGLVATVFLAINMRRSKIQTNPITSCEQRSWQMAGC
jgi:hypothetical protein